MLTGDLATSKIFFIISAIVNLCWALFGIIYVFIVGAATCGFGCLFFILPIVNGVACAMDFVAYNRLNTVNRPGTYSSLQYAAILDIVTFITGNLISVAFGIINLIFINKPENQQQLRDRNIY